MPALILIVPVIAAFISEAPRPIKHQTLCVIDFSVAAPPENWTIKLWKWL